MWRPLRIYQWKFGITASYSAYTGNVRFPAVIYDPEIVLFLRDPIKDKNGYVHYLYIHNDGSADYTTYDATVLNRGVRWIVYHKDWKSMGMVLPSTAEPEGFLAEKEKGNVRRLPGGEKFVSVVTAGYLNQEEAEIKKNMIEDIVK
jgi:hypothetical protein